MLSQDALAKARKSIQEALKARTKDEVIAVATSAIAATMPGNHSYAAGLRTLVGVTGHAHA